MRHKADGIAQPGLLRHNLPCVRRQPRPQSKLTHTAQTLKPPPQDSPSVIEACTDINCWQVPATPPNSQLLHSRDSSLYSSSAALVQRLAKTGAQGMLTKRTPPACMPCSTWGLAHPVHGHAFLNSAPRARAPRTLHGSDAEKPCVGITLPLTCRRGFLGRQRAALLRGGGGQPRPWHDAPTAPQRGP